ncbi:phosphoserine phosphatase SerB [Amorphus orientalis]|uniref:Phosphoserine phosphatase n=1 Tax=Amorphus orientalis TaxID=649198 RepID=A0AAE3VQL3_9HYPH|nr:phosphoserine phosphatase SerB [Amorphus orientalis]MDQ0316562.1 phosphoserine phosphatase [Amorphus orientalis]
MDLVATLIAAPAEPAVDTAAIALIQRILPEADLAVLADNVAVDLAFVDPSDRSARDWQDELRAILGERPIDVVVQTPVARRKRLLIADMDSTLIGQECIDELADALGIKSAIAGITERAMRGEIEFEPALRERVSLLKGLPISVVDEVLAERITLTPGARALVQTMKAHGAYSSLVSGGFTVFSGPIRERLGIDEHQSNILHVADDKVTGTVAEPILGRDAKRARLEELIVELDIPRSDTLAVGDGANDLAMLDGAGLGVAFHAKPKVAEAADVRIDHGDLSALLYLQGYGAADIVE